MTSSVALSRRRLRSGRPHSEQPWWPQRPPAPAAPSPGQRPLGRERAARIEPATSSAGFRQKARFRPVRRRRVATPSRVAPGSSIGSLRRSPSEADPLHRRNAAARDPSLPESLFSWSGVQLFRPCLPFIGCESPPGVRPTRPCRPQSDRRLPCRRPRRGWRTGPRGPCSGLPGVRGGAGWDNSASRTAAHAAGAHGLARLRYPDPGCCPGGPPAARGEPVVAGQPATTGVPGSDADDGHAGGDSCHGRAHRWRVRVCGLGDHHFAFAAPYGRW